MAFQHMLPIIRPSQHYGYYGGGGGRGGVNIDASGGGQDTTTLLLALIQMQLAQQENARRSQIETGQLNIQQQLANAQLAQQDFALKEAARERTAGLYAPVIDRVTRKGQSSMGKEIENLRTTYASAAKDNAVEMLNTDIKKTLIKYQENPSATNKEELRTLIAESVPRRLKAIASDANKSGEFALRGAVGAVVPSLTMLGTVAAEDDDLRKVYTAARLQVDPLVRFADPSAVEARLNELQRGVGTRMEDILLGVQERAQEILTGRDAGRYTDTEARNMLNRLGDSPMPKLEESRVNPYAPYADLENLLTPPIRVQGDPNIGKRVATAEEDLVNMVGRTISGTPDTAVGGSGGAGISPAANMFLDILPFAQNLMGMGQAVRNFNPLAGLSPRVSGNANPQMAIPPELIAAMQQRTPGGSFTLNPDMQTQSPINTQTILQALLQNPELRGR